MCPRTLFPALLLLVSVPAPQEDRPGADVLARFEPSIEWEARTSVLVLGTPHLDTVGGFEPPALASLLDALVAWGPDAVCVEALPGRTIAALRADEAAYAPVLARFAGGAVRFGALAQGLVELERPAAAAVLREEWAALSTLDRLLYSLAAFELPTATLQWSLLHEEGGAAGAELPGELVRFLDGRLASRNELDCLALPVARRLGLDRIDAVDDHLDKDAYLGIADDLTRELAGSEELGSAAGAEVYTASASSLAAALEAGDLLPHYLHVNAPEYAEADVRAQWDVFLRTGLESGLDRARLALWDVRNLAIAANVRRVTARHPGGRVLVVIGASHRPFLEALLAPALDLAIVRLEEVVEPEPAAGPARRD
jgi:hypothetical protein